MRRAALAAAVAAVLAAAPGAEARPWEWVQGTDVVASPDGRNVYAAGATTLSFAVDPASGALSLIGYTEPGASSPQMAISPDGRFVYVARGEPFPAGAIHVMSRDPATGLLTHIGNFLGGSTAAVGFVEDLEIAPDGRHLYAAGRNPARITVYERDPSSGGLTQSQALFRQPHLESLAFVSDLAIAPDGRHVYAVGGGILLLSRDPATGALTNTGPVTSDSKTDQAVAVSADGGQVFGGRTSIDAWRRNGDGALTHLGHAALAEPGCGPCDEGEMIVPAPDGQSVFTAEDGGLVEATTAPDAAPAFRRRYAGVPGLGRPNAMAWRADGRYAYVASTSRGGRDGAVAAFRRTGDGLELVNAAGPSFDVPALPTVSQPPTVTIDDGAIYTNDREVEVTVDNNPYTSSIQLSNAEDLAGARTQRIVLPRQTYSWTLATSGPERSVKRVHVRFLTIDDKDKRLFDDIILDERPPEVVAARIDGRRLILKARDNRSGVERMQVTTSRKKPGKARSYRRVVSVSRKTKALHVRVLDGAGNTSKWRTVRRP